MDPVLVHVVAVDLLKRADDRLSYLDDELVGEGERLVLDVVVQTLFVAILKNHAVDHVAVLLLVDEL